MNETIEIFCCYAQEDHPFVLTLKTHLGIIRARMKASSTPVA